MLVWNTTERALPTRFPRLDATGKRLWRTEYLGPAPSPRSPTLDPGVMAFVMPERDAPQSFRIEQEPGLIVHPHFHYVDQFQIVIEGGGELGRHRAEPLTVHYASGHTGYGPITAGPQGLTYVTLRAQADTTGAQYLPGARERMHKVPKRHRLADPCPPLGDEGLAALRGPDVVTLFDEDDGLGAWVFRLPAGACVQGPDPARGGGQSIVLSHGSTQLEGEWLDRHSCLYLSSSAAPLPLQAGPRGLEIVFCQYARR